MYIDKIIYMDFGGFKNKAKSYAKKANTSLNRGIDKSIHIVGKSSFVISEKKELDALIKESKNFTNSYGKISRKKCIIIFAHENSPFYKHILTYIAPILFVKAWTQKIQIKLSNMSIKELNSYGVTESPALIVIEDQKIIKIIHGKESIEKVVKSANMDINDLMNNL